MIEPEKYNKFGEIIKQVEPQVFERKMTTIDKHRIHETKDLFDGDCPLCQDAAKKHRETYWGDDE